MVVTFKKYVIDASVVLAWLLPDEIYKQKASLILEKHGRKEILIIAPTLLLFEIVNGLNASVLSRRISLDSGEKLLTIYKDFEVSLIPPLEKDVLFLADEFHISSYDGAYLSLSHQEDIPFITADRKLFRNIKVEKDVIWIEEFS